MDNKKQNPAIKILKKTLKSLELELKDLDKEWERLDSMGTETARQQQLSVEIEVTEKAIAWAKEFLKGKK